MRRWGIVAAVLVSLPVLADVAFAQGVDPKAQTPPLAGQAGQGGGRRAAAGRGADGGGQPADRIALAELQRLFDAYFVLQAQEALQLDDSQFGQFLPRLKGLQDARRRDEQTRRQLVQELAKLIAPGEAFDETKVKEKLRAVQDLDARAAAEVRRAYDALDQILDVRQQARFRVFEQNMERKKFELMLRARRAEAARGPAGQRP